MGRLRVKNNVLEQRIFTGRVTLAGAIVALLLFTILGRLFYLQVVQHSYYADLSQGNRIRIGGLGILQVRKRAARMGRNPATGEAIKIKASKKLAFRAAKEVKDAI